MRDDVNPGDARPTLVRLGQRGEDLDRRRLAGAVRSQQPEHGPGLDAERQAVERLHALRIQLDQTLGLDRLLHAWFTSRYRVLEIRYLSY